MYSLFLYCDCFCSLIGCISVVLYICAVYGQFVLVWLLFLGQPSVCMAAISVLHVMHVFPGLSASCSGIDFPLHVCNTVMADSPVFTHANLLRYFDLYLKKKRYRH